MRGRNERRGRMSERVWRSKKERNEESKKAKEGEEEKGWKNINNNRKTNDKQKTIKIKNNTPIPY